MQIFVKKIVIICQNYLFSLDKNKKGNFFVNTLANIKKKLYLCG